MKRFKIFLCLSVGLTIGQSLHAATYYISGSSQASDINIGTSQSSPWKTITKLNTVNLQPGDSALFECGYVYRGQINARAGALGSPVYYGAYGSGPAPVISGAMQLGNTGWTVYQGAIYVKSNVVMPAMSAAEPPNLFVNGRLMIPARYPNTGYLTADNVYGINPGSHCCEMSYSLQDASLNGVFPNAADLLGAHITGYDAYSVSSRMINSYIPASGILNFDTLKGMGFMESKLYFFSRKLNLLDTPGEWYYDDAVQKLYIWKPDGTAPSAGDTLEYSSYIYGISDWQIPYITVEGLEFRYQQIAGMWVIRSTDVTIRNNRFYECKYGIHGWGSSTTSLSGTIVTNNSFVNIHRVAINLNNYLDHAMVSRNTISNIARNNALMQSGNPDQWGNYGYWEYGLGIQFNGTNSEISLNRIDSTGRQAIAAGGTNTLIQNNVIDCPCLNYNDCGGIMPLGNSSVDRNIIRNSFGYFSSADYYGYGARGIYPDFQTGDKITNNTIVNTVLGIGLTNSKNEIVRGNTVYNALKLQFRMNRKDAGQLNNTIKRNIFFAVTHDQNSLTWDNQVSGADNNSSLDSNLYWNPYSYYPVIKYRSDGTLSEIWYDLAQWQASGKELNSKKEFKFRNQPYVIRDTIGGSLIQNGRFNAGTTGWSNTGNMVFTTAGGQLDTTCADVTYNGVYSGTLSQNISLSFIQDSLYLIGFSLKATVSSDGDALELKLVETTDNTKQHFYRAFKNLTARNDYWSVFRADTTIPLTIQFTSPNGRYYIDNVQIYPVTANWINPNSVFPIFINETSSPMVVTLPPCDYLDLDSNLVGPTLTLQPFSSQILVLVNDSCLYASLNEHSSNDAGTLKVYPNPATEKITIEYNIPRTNFVSLNIFDLSGNKLLSLLETRLAAGIYSQTFSISGFKSGIYVVSCNSGGNTYNEKIVIVR